uniref:Uncharacterized protein n=1 Tax=viral metagenome TaxID=1070528 RepID=A0A6C0FCJ9_9ZZZZ|tara:strand:- start:28290 stop:29522 length:1233 start_codon:yes stop_codon:yes gene_type:complete
MATPKLAKGKLPTESDYKDLPTEKMMEIILNTFTTEELIESTNMDPFIYASFQKEGGSPDGAGGESSKSSKSSSSSKTKSPSPLKTPSSEKKYIMKFKKKNCIKGKGSKYTVQRMRQALIKIGMVRYVEQFKTFPPKAEFNNLCALISSVRKRWEGKSPGSSISWKSRKNAGSVKTKEKPAKLSRSSSVSDMKAKIVQKKAQAKKEAQRNRSKSSSKSKRKILGAAESYFKEVFSLVQTCDNITKGMLKENVMKRTKLSKEKVKKHLTNEVIVDMMAKFCRKAKKSPVKSKSLSISSSSRKSGAVAKKMKGSKSRSVSTVSSSSLPSKTSSSRKSLAVAKKAAPAPVKRKGSPSPVKVALAKREVKKAGGIGNVKGEKLKSMARTLGAVHSGKSVAVVRTNIMAILNKYK